MLRDPWMNEDRDARQALLDELNRRLAGAVEVVAGSEVWYTDELVGLAETTEAGPLTPLAGSRYLLVEFPPGFVPAQAAAAFHELTVMGRVPVIAHPERNLVFAGDLARLGELVEAGGVGQVTAGSLSGEFGRGARKAAERMIELGLAGFVASDAHDLKRRPPRMRVARERVRELFGAEVEAGLFDANPAAVLADRELPWSRGA